MDPPPFDFQPNFLWWFLIDFLLQYKFSCVNKIVKRGVLPCEWWAMRDNSWAMKKANILMIDHYYPIIVALKYIILGFSNTNPCVVWEHEKANHITPTYINQSPKLVFFDQTCGKESSNKFVISYTETIYVCVTYLKLVRERPQALARCTLQPTTFCKALYSLLETLLCVLWVTRVDLREITPSYVS